jgi:hypothetical protein
MEDITPDGLPVSVTPVSATPVFATPVSVKPFATRRMLGIGAVLSGSPARPGLPGEGLEGLPEAVPIAVFETIPAALPQAVAAIASPGH